MKKENSKFKVKIVSLILLLSVLSCNTIEIEPYRPVIFSGEGLPESLESLKEDLPFTNYRYASLETGTDTLKVFFGMFMQGSNKGNWVSVESQGGGGSFFNCKL